MLPLIYQLMPLDPRASAAMVAWVALAGALGGAALWLFGSRFSQTLVTLIAVGIGAGIGLKVPQWFGLPIGTWATAVGGALIVGMAGYAMHTLWEGIALALLLGAWGMAGTLMFHGLPPEWIMPLKTPEMSRWNWMWAVWGSLPADVTRMASVVSAVGVIAGLAMGVFWTRVAVMALHSVAGVTLMVGLGLIAIELRWPAMLGIVPDQRFWRVMSVVGMVLFGMLVQWRVATVPKPAKKEEGDE